MNIFTLGAVVNPALWVFVFPTGSGGLAQNVPNYILQSLHSKGIFVVGAHFPGCDGGEEDFGAKYREILSTINYVKTQYGLTAPPVFYCQSRGALQGLSFAADNPGEVLRIACLYPATTPSAYPGRGQSYSIAHNKTDAELDAVESSGVTVISKYTPNSKAAALIGKTICIWHGDSDAVVPKTMTTDVFAPQAHSWVKAIPCFGHEPPSEATMDEIVHFIQWNVLPEGAVQQ